jgi:RNA polymerase sigma factor (sigma-70 family)
MEPVDDSALLRQFAENHSDEAFAELVARHVNLVYSMALRRAGHPQNAEEITQAVFIILAKKAAGLRHEKALSSWLFQATRFTAINFMRGEIRRQNREKEAQMQTILNESSGEVWPKIAPLLDDAVAALREKERRAIVLRFYEGRSLREVGLALGASEDAAKKRVGRALEKLRQFFAKRGVDSTTAAIAETISAHSVQIAPLALAKTISAVAVAKGATASTSTLTLIKGALKIMAWTKAKTAIVTGVVVLFTAGTATVAVKEVRHSAKAAYDGNLLSQTLLSYQRSRDSAAEAAARKALAKMGTNAIPALLNLLRRDSADKNLAARAGFSLLGSNASTAVPDLIRIYEERISGPSQSETARSLGWIGPDAEPAVPLLLESATNGNDDQAFAAVMALGQIHADSQTVVPALIRLVHSTNRGVAIVTVEALGKFGPSARDAIPVLLQVVTNYPANGWRPAYSASDAIRDIQGHYP